MVKEIEYDWTGLEESYICRNGTNIAKNAWTKRKSKELLTTTAKGWQFKEVIFSTYKIFKALLRYFLEQEY